MDFLGTLRTGYRQTSSEDFSGLAAADPQLIDLIRGVRDLCFQDELAYSCSRFTRITCVALAVIALTRHEPIEAEQTGVDVQQAAGVLTACMSADLFHVSWSIHWPSQSRRRDLDSRP